VPSQNFIHRRNPSDFRPKGARNHYIFLGGRSLEKGHRVSYLPFVRRYRCGGPCSFAGPLALQYGREAMTPAKPRPPLAPGETRAYPVLPLRDIVVFPHVIAPLFVGRKKSILALEEVMRSDIFILLATQKNASDDEPGTEAIYEIGTLANVLQLLKLPDGTAKVLVEGVQRAKVVKYTDCSEYYEAEAVALGDTMGERVAGTSSPSASAVSRLMTSSNWWPARSAVRPASRL
jgi:ATP-dependent protease La (LON) substrate-binding domain